MKLFCVFISLVFINVSAYDQTDYKKEVFITNLLIQKACENKYENRNGLEYIIEDVVYNDRHLMDTMNLMFAVPEFAAADKIFECVLVQRKLQSKVIVGLFIPPPEVKDEYVQTIKLSDLGKERRICSRAALENVIIRALDKIEPEVPLSEMCTFLGLWTSTKIPTQFIKEVLIDEEKYVCVLKDKDNRVKKYRSIDGVYYQIDVDDIAHRIVSLREQLD